jgi:type II secretory pathway pseudopilin PulG
MKLRRGVTMLEILVSLSCIALLSAIVVPAIQRARMAASAVACQNNFRQLSIAMQGYLSSTKQFPKSGVRGSTFVALRSYLEATDMSARSHALPKVLLCPADSVFAGFRFSTNVGENRGWCVLPQGRFQSSPISKFNGVILHSTNRLIVTPASIRDGLSNTVCFGELLPLPRVGRSVFYQRGRSSWMCLPVSELVQQCELAPLEAKNHPSPRGRYWFSSAVESTGFTTAFPPNGRECFF